MSGLGEVDLSACRHWRPSLTFGEAWVGIIPAWNAVTLLNGAAARIWDLAMEARDVNAIVSGYATTRPDRAPLASADVEACLAAWAAQGFFRTPEPSFEQHKIAGMAGQDLPATQRAVFRRCIALTADAPAVKVEVSDPDLGRALEDLLIDFPDAPDAGATCLQVTHTENGWLQAIDAKPARLAGNLAEARAQVVSELIRLAGGSAGWRATLHGSVLTSPAGTIFLAGSTGAGKSTLAAGLIARGWALAAEDVAPLNETLGVVPLPFALSIKQGSVATLAGVFPGLEHARAHRLGPRLVRYRPLTAVSRATQPVRPGLVFDVAFRPDLDPDAAVLTRLSPPETLSLFTNEESFIDFTRDPENAFLRFVESTPAYTLRFGSIEAAARAIHDRLTGRREGMAR